MRRLVVDLASAGTAWRVPPASLQAIRDALGTGWEMVEVVARAATEGDGVLGTPEAEAAALGAEVYFGYGVPAGVATVARATLRWAHSGTAGVGSALRHLAGTGIILTNSAAMHAEPTADWVIASIAYFARGLDRMRQAQVERHWARDDFTELHWPVAEFTDVRVGVFGLGGIGSAVARRALALGMPVAGVRRRPELGGPEGLRWVGGFGDLARLAGESDCLVIAAPQTRETTGVVDGAILDRLPDGAVVINVSRGQLLSEDALLRVLDSGRLRGAALDVFMTEPLPSGHRFWDHPRVLISPHAAAVSSRFWERETGLIVENVRRYLAGAPLLNVVDQEAGY
jgi:phosphoglycerate dehydrogenase-like enzyme